MNALITAIGSFAADIVIKTLKKNGYFVAGCDVNPRELIADACNVESFYQSPYAKNQTEFLSFVDEVCRKEQIDIVLPLLDIEIDAFNAHRRRSQDYHVFISSEAAINLCRNKQKQYERLRDVGVTQLIPTALMSENMGRELRFPVVCKPLDGRSSEGLYVVESLLEYEVLKKKVNSDQYIVQPFLKGGIVTVDVVRQPSTNQCVAIPRKELLRTKSGAGTSVLVFHNDYVENLAKRIAEALGVMGCVNMEFIVDEQGQYHYVECNARFAGGVEFSCMSGYDMVTNHLKCFFDQPIDEMDQIQEQYIARKYEEYVTRKL